MDKITACPENAGNAKERDEWFSSDCAPILRAWCAEQSKSISACYVAFLSGSPVLHVFVISVGDYDHSWDEAVSRLGLDLTKKNRVPYITQLPAKTKEERQQHQSYFRQAEAILVYSQTEATLDEPPDPTVCPENHHTKDGPCRRDYCFCRCERCERECSEMAY